MTRPVFRVPTDLLRDARSEDAVELTGPEGHHARTVRRLGPGEELDLVDGRGLRAPGVVRELLPEGLLVGLLADPAPEPVGHLVLVQALAKGDRDLMSVEMATELGVAAIVPWQAERSIVRWKGERAARSHAKWERTAAAAAKQARRAVVPEVHPLADLEALLGQVGPEDLVLVLHEQAREPLSREVADRLPDPQGPGRVLLVVGPEGGISPEETRRLVAAGAHPVRLGPEVLRTSTAGAAALAVLQVLSGHWSQPGPGLDGPDTDGTAADGADPLTPDPDDPAASS